PGNTGSYDATLSCDNDATPDENGTFTVTAAMVASGEIGRATCRERESTVVLPEYWKKGATGDRANLSITGGVVGPAPATSTVTTDTGPTFTDQANQADEGVQSGGSVTVWESLPPGNTGSYDATLSCDNDATPDENGTFTVTAAMVASG